MDQPLDPRSVNRRALLRTAGAGAASLAVVSAALQTLAVPAQAAVADPANNRPKRKPGRKAPTSPTYVVLAWDGTGDFGPETPGTTTAGWQEAVDEAIASGQDLLVKGGNPNAVYNIAETIHIPATQDFRILGTCYILNWVGPANDTGGLLDIDSSMNCEFHFGILVYGGLGRGLQIKPRNPVPIDNVSVTTETRFIVEGVVDPNPFSPGTTPIGDGFVVDGSVAPIVWNVFTLYAMANFDTVVETVGPFVNNDLTVVHLHSNRTDGTLCRIGDGSRQNTIRLLAIGADQGATGITGVQVAGAANEIQVKTRPGDTSLAGDRTIVLDASASGNRIDFVPHDTYTLASKVTDDATAATNMFTGPTPLPAQQLEVPAGTYTHAQRLYPAQAVVSGGGTPTLSVTRGSLTVPVAGASVVLSVGDTLTVDATAPGTLTLLPLAHA